MKKIFITFFAILAIFGLSSLVNAQTNVSGGIYSSTTWTLANSPYIVTDTIVVFPGVALTIQPGVVVKFDDNVILEIRQGALIAQGTSTDSITFMSNSTSPSPGIYEGIYLNGGSLQSKFNFCKFQHAFKAINYNTTDTLTVRNSNFIHNDYGIYTTDLGSAPVALIDSCNFKNNTSYGLDFTYSRGTIFMNDCNILYNGTGFAGLYKNGSIIRNCTFDHNLKGLFAQRILIDNCHIGYNQTGLKSYSLNHIKNCEVDSNSLAGLDANGDSVINCHVAYNGIGIKAAVAVVYKNIIEHNNINILDNFGWGGSDVIGNIIRYGNVGIDSIAEDFTITENIIENNAIGINLDNSVSTIYCNRICNNTIYDLDYGSASNVDVSNNYWCTSDSASTEAVVFDGYDNINYGLALFMPLDTQQCYLSGNCSAYFYLYPDPYTLHQYYAVNMTSGSQPLSYLWSWGDGNYDNIPNPNHTYSAAGYYNICCTITDQSGCTKTYCDSSFISKESNTMISVNVISPTVTGIIKNSNDDNFVSIFPNPATDNITITNYAKKYNGIIAIYDIQGEMLIQQPLQEERTRIDISSLTKGMYFIKLMNGKSILSGKFIKD